MANGTHSSGLERIASLLEEIEARRDVESWHTLSSAHDRNRLKRGFRSRPDP
jgi:hypothetical protein